MNTYASLEDKPYESHYLYVDTIIDHPVERVWKHAVKISTWMTDYRLVTLAGIAGEVGHFERVYPPGLAEGTPPPHYHLYGIAELIPNKCIFIEVFPERGGSYGKTREWLMFDNILLVDLGGRTKVIFFIIDVHPGRAAQPESHDDAVLRDRLERYFVNLKKLADNDAQ